MSAILVTLSAIGAAAGAALALFLAGAIVFLAVFLPLAALGARLLPDAGPKRLEGISSLAEALAAGRASGLEGLELAAWAQGLAARRFEYSRRNPWDSPERCFERGYGYCVQQARALKMLCDGLGLRSRVVQAFRCRFPPMTVHGETLAAGIGGHSWVRAFVDGRELDLDSACPGPRLGELGVEPLSRVVPMPGILIPVFHVLSVAENARRDRRNILRGMGR